MENRSRPTTGMYAFKISPELVTLAYLYIYIVLIQLSHPNSVNTQNDRNQQRQGNSKDLIQSIHTAIQVHPNPNNLTPVFHSKPTATRRSIVSSKAVIHKHRSPTPSSG